MTIEYRSSNELCGIVIARTLVALGCRYAVIAPGSRSTPLVLGITKESSIRSISVLDERSAGFLALGLAKAERTPVVVITTSGTAGANLFPAVIEASESGIPLLILTADRPPEMRDCQSGQTIDQVKLFGKYPVGYLETMVPESTELSASYFRQILIHAWGVASGEYPGKGGVYHLNIPFRDPLTPDAEAGYAGIEWTVPHHAGTLTEQHSRVALPEELQQIRRGIIIVGYTQGVVEQKEILKKLSVATGWPVLADPLSGLRELGEIEGLICNYDLCLRCNEFADLVKPKFVLQIGGLPTSKVLRQRLQEWQPLLWVLERSGKNVNALHLPAKEWGVGLESLDFRRGLGGQKGENGYYKRWRQADEWGEMESGRLLVDKPAFEGRWVKELVEMQYGEEIPLLVGNSMPVRDWEYFQPNRKADIRTYANRGANGIDGILSTAVGLAEARGKALLVCGDLSLLHDTNGFLHQKQMTGELTVLLIDNQGGGIFRHLPVREENPPFDQFFLTQQEVQWELLGKAYGVEVIRLPKEKSWKSFLKFTGRPGIRILRWGTNSLEDSKLRMTYFRERAEQLGKHFYL